MRVGLIGCGLIGGKRVAALRPEDRLVAVQDRERGRAERLAGTAAPGAQVVGHWQEVLEAGIDAVLIAVTHDHLAPMTGAALEAGLHVLVEKPAGRHVDEITPLVALAARMGRVVKVGYNHRFHPAVREAKRLVDAGEVGELLFVRGRYGHGGRVGYEKEWRCRPEISGGGELIDQGSHLIDLSRWFLGEFSVVQGHLDTAFWSMPVEDNCFLSLRTATGRTAWLHASWSEWKNLFCFEIYGRTGKLQIDGLGGSYGLERLSHYRMSPAMGPPETLIREYPFPDESWREEYLEFIRAIAGGREPSGSIRDAQAVMAIVAELYRGHSFPAS
ncbi:MAG: Gfo/Idh/MocA family oxidoreductase [Magnetococcales bacterium]|nr:Gfo/Idh/MocA family oxidoreductase [Magnetococcales bacterium]